MKPALLFALLLSFFWGRSQPSLTQRFDSLTTAYEDAGFHGVILVARGADLLYEKGYGYANFEQKIRHTPATLFKTESVGKMFTATAVLQMVEQGKLRLTQTVAEVLPELRIRNAAKITIDHLLKHTSGMQSPWDHPNWTFKKEYSKAELMKVVEEVPPAFDEPGKEMFYSNSGYCVLGWMVEAVTGRSFDQYLQEQVFAPLRMAATIHLNDTVMPVQTGAQPYRLINSKRYTRMARTVGPKASAAGGWVSTARDLYRFVQALNGGRLLKPETLHAMRTANGANPKDSAYRFYAYGLETHVNQAVPGVSLYGHNGGGAGFSVDAFVEPVSGVIVISCTNLHQNSRPITFNYFRTALSQPPKPVTRPLSVRLYDVIDSVGIHAFAQNAKAYFAQLNVQPHPGVFAEVSDAMNEAGEPALAARWLAIGRSYHPEEGFLWLLSGDTEQLLGHKTEALAYLQQARLLGEKRNDQRLLRAVEEKLKAM